MHGQLLAHLHISDARGESGDNLGVGDAWDLVADLAEALDVLTQGLTGALAHSAEVVPGAGSLVRPLEVDNELLAQLAP